MFYGPAEIPHSRIGTRCQYGFRHAPQPDQYGGIGDAQLLCCSGARIEPVAIIGGKGISHQESRDRWLSPPKVLPVANFRLPDDTPAG
jgi:hypothetical protein